MIDYGVMFDKQTCDKQYILNNKTQVVNSLRLKGEKMSELKKTIHMRIFTAHTLQQ